MPAGKHLSRVGFLGIPKSQQNVDLSKTGSVSRIRTFCDFLCFRKKFPRGPGDGFCDFVCFRTSKISGYFRELNKSGGEVYKSPGCFAALRRYPCLRVQSSNSNLSVRVLRPGTERASCSMISPMTKLTSCMAPRAGRSHGHEHPPCELEVAQDAGGERTSGRTRLV